MTSEEPKRQLQDHEIWFAIEDFALGSEEEVAAMTEEQLDVHLAERGIDFESRYDEMHSKIAAAAGQLRLRMAQQERIKAEQTRRDDDKPRMWNAPNIGDKTKDILDLSGPALRAQIIQKLGPSYGASAHFHRLENASEEDLREILKDLDELDEE